jgi:CrcB protein
MKTVWLIALGGVAGTLARYGLQGWVQLRAGGGFPTGTLAVNVLGSFVLGFIMRFAVGTTVVSPELRAGLAIGFCGAFTTMSTFGYETLGLLRDGQYGFAGLYLGATIAGSLGAILIGSALAGRLL